ncbi:MAG: phosphoglycerate kinase [bacterium]|nr:phosphoglycerate kinase [bacterium]
MFEKLLISDLNLDGKKLIIRTDFNVPQDEQGNITDDRKIKESIPSINYALSKKAKVILISHLSRPKGEIVESMRLNPIAKRLSELLGKEVKKLDDCLGEEVKSEISKMQEGEVILLENIRFYKEETQNEENFAKELAGLGDLFVNEAFSASHRAHASVVGITNYISQSAAGFQLEKEIEYLGKTLKNPKRPFLALLGGAKVSTKIGVVGHLLDKVDAVLIGGGMAYSFLKVKGKSIGSSMVEEDKLNIVKQTLIDSEKFNTPIYLPTDHVVAKSIHSTDHVMIAEEIMQDWIGVDIGPKTTSNYISKIKEASTIIWNGPMGIFETDAFSKGTFAIAQALANSSATTIVCGGDSDAVIDKLNIEDKITHVSSAGGACLEFLKGKELPGIVALTNK